MWTRTVVNLRAGRPHTQRHQLKCEAVSQELHQNHQSMGAGGSDVIKCLCVFSYLANKKGSSSIFQFLFIIYYIRLRKRRKSSNCYCKIV